MMRLIRSSSTRAPIGRRTSIRRRARKDEHGQILVLFVLAIVVIMGLAAMAIDVGVLRNANQNLWNALDAGALAGAMELPDNAADADTIARQYAEDNYPGGLPDSVQLGFRCVIGSVGGAPRSSDVPGVCDPGPAPVWSCNATVCAAVCVPGASTSCNTIVLDGTATVPYVFGRAVGVETGTTQPVVSAACKGPCGTKPAAPVDLVVVVDRTSSMSGVDTDNARVAADAVRKLYNPAEQWMGFGMLGPSDPSPTCVTRPDTVIGTASLPGDLDRWIPIGMTGIGAPNNANYAATGSDMAVAINCYTNSSVGTDLTDPIPAAAWELMNNGRPATEVTKGIILMSDGQPNNSTTPDPTEEKYCAQSFASAQAAKAQGIELFTIGFGLDGSFNIDCPDTAGPYSGKKARTLLADMATSSVDNGCPGTSNDDGDHFFCVPKTAGASTNLANLFRQAANQLVGGTKLISLP
ncbi:MAG: pilus assembly protein TadG-related protein [Aeromicrobium sp.]